MIVKPTKTALSWVWGPGPLPPTAEAKAVDRDPTSPTYGVLLYYHLSKSYQLGAAGVQHGISIRDALDMISAISPSAWGGHRDGAGRKPSGRTPWMVRVTDEEREKVKEYLAKIRK